MAMLVEGNGASSVRAHDNKRPGRRWNVPGAGTGDIPPMQDHPNGGPPASAAASVEHEHDVQRAVLLALLAAPSDHGEPVSTLAAAIHQPRAAVQDAVELLAWIGLLHKRGRAIRATAAAMHLAELWPVPR
jgi:hypothetical protein